MELRNAVCPPRVANLRGTVPSRPFRDRLHVCVIQDASTLWRAFGGPTGGRCCVSTGVTKANKHCPGLHRTETSPMEGPGTKQISEGILSSLTQGVTKDSGIKGSCENLCHGTKKNSHLHPWPLNAFVFRELPQQAKVRPHLLPAGVL